MEREGEYVECNPKGRDEHEKTEIYSGKWWRKEEIRRQTDVKNKKVVGSKQPRSSPKGNKSVTKIKRRRTTDRGRVRVEQRDNGTKLEMIRTFFVTFITLKYTKPKGIL